MAGIPTACELRNHSVLSVHLQPQYFNFYVELMFLIQQNSTGAGFCVFFALLHFKFLDKNLFSQVYTQ